MKYTLIILLSSLLFLTSCKKEDDDCGCDDPQTGKVAFNFKFKESGESLILDTLKYVNAAGNKYMVTEVQYFISDVVLHCGCGSDYPINEWKDIHYVDIDLENTLRWEVYDEIVPGTIDAISFTFGLDEDKNQSMMFVNPPESFMFWPEHLGGGYHYMKLNGKWEDTLQLVRPFNFHLGIGQIYHSYPDSITGFIHNHFRVNIPVSNFEIMAGQTTELDFTMLIDEWFKNPNTYNHNVYGGDIMQKQAAMAVASQNGQNAFAITIKN